MSLWEMSICGGIFIAAIIIIRGLFRKRFPGKVFQVLWLAAILRLLVPFAVPWQYSVYSLAEHCAVEFTGVGILEDGALEEEISGYVPAGAVKPGNAVPATGGQEMDATVSARESSTDAAVLAGDGWQKIMRQVIEQMRPIFVFVYLSGAVLCTLYYAVSYFRWRRELQTSLPVEDPQIWAWAEALPLRRKITVRQWEGTVTPLAYGVFHPVILLPKSLAKEAHWQLKFVLVHEYMHIRHFDAVKKMFLLLACCVHWFNPLVWVMGILANRDLELECDERVIKYLGRDSRADYAYALIDMEEQRSVFLSWVNSFSKNAMEERVVAIMKGSKKSIAAGILSGMMTAGVIMAFVTSAFAMDKAENVNQVYADSSENIAYAYDEGDASEGINGQIDVGLPEEYASLGITADPHTASWEYQGKKVAVFYDKDRWLLTCDIPSKDTVYLEVCRDKDGKIEKLKECSKKEMQKLLKKKGLVF